MTATERLAEIKAELVEIYDTWGLGDEILLGSRSEMAGLSDTAGTLIAALEAVLEKHRPVHRIFSWSSGIRDEEPCPDCHGKAGVHDCGCWADEDVTYSCATCRTDKGGGVDYPCPTVEALNEALGVGQ